jgi:hypothetical protein
MARTRIREAADPRGKKPISDMAPEDAEMSRHGAGTRPDGAGGAPRQPKPSNNEEIRARAYQRYEQRGRADGRADEDWYEAEKELRSRR